MKISGFYDNAHFHICSTYLRLVVSSYIKIHYFQIEPSKMGAHANESMLLKMFTDSSDEQSAFDGL